MYKQIVEFYKQEKVDFSKVKTFNLDEYVGLANNNPNSYRYYMENNLFKYINIPVQNTNVPDGLAKDTNRECEQYDEKINASGGIDLQILGIGNNGHIGFNEPSDFLYIGTHVTNLAQGTIMANSRYFSNIEEVPTKAITMGLGSIMRAKKIILLASGHSKAEIISKLTEGRISTNVPASILQVHPDVTVIVDREAANQIDQTHCA
jgi:glucosamine-6-phosphate deaminase